MNETDKSAVETLSTSLAAIARKLMATGLSPAEVPERIEAALEMHDMGAAIKAVTDRHPCLVANVSGPWHDKGDPAPVYICNWKDNRFSLREIAVGSAGSTPADAVRNSLESVDAYMEKLPLEQLGVNDRMM